MKLDYYPFGLEMAHSWEQLPNSVANPFRYNAGAEKNDQTGNYETLFRQYDPAIGRMLAVDPVAARYSSVSPYNYAFNDPVFWNDPSGADPNDWNYTSDYIDQNENDIIYQDHGQAYVQGHGGPALAMLNGISDMMNGGSVYHGERGAGLIDWGYAPGANYYLTNQLFSMVWNNTGSDGGRWTRADGISSFDDAIAATYAGAQYNDEFGLWGTFSDGAQSITHAIASVGKSYYGPTTSVESIDQNGVWYTFKESREDLHKRGFMYSGFGYSSVPFGKKAVTQNGFSGHQAGIGEALFIAGLAVEPFKDFSNAYTRHNMELIKAAWEQGRTPSQLSNHRRIYRNGLKAGKAIRAVGGSIVVVGVVADFGEGVYHSTQGNTGKAYGSYAMSSAGIIAAGTGPAGLIWYGLNVIEGYQPNYTNYTNPLIVPMDNTKVINLKIR